MKKLLFVMNHLHCGGAEKSLLSLLQTIDYDRFEVDLLLFKREGMFLHQLPSQVNILDAPPNYLYFEMPIVQAITQCMRTYKFRLAYERVRAGLIFKTDHNAARCEQRIWKHLSKGMPVIHKRYDAAIGFLEKTPVYFCIDKVTANKKLGFIHNDYLELGMEPLYDQDRFRHLDYLLTVSDSCGTVLERCFPDYQSKVKVMHNIVSPALVRKLALERNPYYTQSKGIHIVSMGRLHTQKGFDLAIHACRSLLDRGYQINWYIIGEGEERGNLERMIKEYQLENHCILLGLLENPYPIMKQADIYVQPSRFEGKSIAIDEAKILAKPIVVTDFSTARDAIAAMSNGLIVSMSVEGIVEGISKLIDNKELRSSFSRQLSDEALGTESEINKLYELIC